MSNMDSSELEIYSTNPISNIEMGRDDINIICTYGKISIWFGRTVADNLIWKILTSISIVDKLAVHEKEIVCSFEDITSYESKGYILISYAKFESKYRATFNIPFARKNALIYLADSISKQLKDKNVSVDVYWTGNDIDITKLYQELKNIDGWKLKNINYKEEGKSSSSS